MKKLKLAAVAALCLAVTACSQYGFYTYKSPYTYDPTDPDYKMVPKLYKTKTEGKWHAHTTNHYSTNDRTAGSGKSWDAWNNQGFDIVRQETVTPSVVVYPLETTTGVYETQPVEIR